MSVDVDVLLKNKALLERNTERHTIGVKQSTKPWLLAILPVHCPQTACDTKHTENSEKEEIKMKHFINRNPATLERVGEPFKSASAALNNCVIGVRTYLEQENYKPLTVAKQQDGIFILFTDFEGEFCRQQINDSGQYIGG